MLDFQNSKPDSILFNPSKHAFFLGFNSFKIWHSRVFGIAAYKSELNIQKFKMADPLCWKKMQKVTWLGWYLVRGVFGVANYESELKIQ